MQLTAVCFILLVSSLGTAYSHGCVDSGDAEAQCRKAGCDPDRLCLGEETGCWKVLLNKKKVKICFSRDTMDVLVDGVCMDAMAYTTNEGYDLDLYFEVEGDRGHIYSDVEGSEITNYLFVDDQLLAQTTTKNCHTAIKHKPGKKILTF